MMTGKIDKFLKVQLDGRGKIYLQVIDESARWGFYLTDGDSAWDGGFGMPPHSEVKVTRRRCPKLDWVQSMIECGIAEPYLEKYALLYNGVPLDVFLKFY